MAKISGNKYFGQITRVIDGDTFEAFINLGFGITQRFCVRLEGIDTPEKSTIEGKQAKQYVKDLIEGKTVLFKDAGSEKYGRSLAKIEMSDGTDLTQFLLEKQIGIEYSGKRKKFVSALSIIKEN
jgi:endonuclease YncB( thermonuclease family)